MTRLWRFSRPDGDPPPPSSDVVPEHYESRPVRPVTQGAARAGLWAAVGFGCLAGLIGLLRPPAGQASSAGEASADSGLVPAPVAGVAELVVEEWLTATDDDLDRIDALFVERPSLDDADTGALAVTRAVTVAGRHMEDGYWAVTVAADVAGAARPATDDDDAASGAAPGAASGVAAGTTTWFLEVAIVGDSRGGLAALTVPAIVPPPPAASTRWRPSAEGPEAPADDDPVAVAAQGFLSALLAGGGDPSRYLAPGVSLSAIDPPPFASVDVTEMTVDDLDRGEVRALVYARGTTPGGSSQTFSYELIARRRVDRWEITRFSGAPTLVLEQADPGPADTAASTSTSTTTTTTIAAEPGA